jgi:hypothetical protein
VRSIATVVSTTLHAPGPAAARCNVHELCDRPLRPPWHIPGADGGRVRIAGAPHEMPPRRGVGHKCQSLRFVRGPEPRKSLESARPHLARRV